MSMVHKQLRKWAIVAFSVTETGGQSRLKRVLYKGATDEIQRLKG